MRRWLAISAFAHVLLLLLLVMKGQPAVFESQAPAALKLVVVVADRDRERGADTPGEPAHTTNGRGNANRSPPR